MIKKMTSPLQDLPLRLSCLKIKTEYHDFINPLIYLTRKEQKGTFAILFLIPENFSNVLVPGVSAWMEVELESREDEYP